MYRTNNLREKPIKKLFFSYLIPAVFGMLLMSVNTMTDAIMVSRGMEMRHLQELTLLFQPSPYFMLSHYGLVWGRYPLFHCARENKITHARSIFHNL